jgi:hypothetical protein
MTATKITGLNPSHIDMAVAAGLPIAKQGKSVLTIDAAPGDALTALDAAKANVVKDRGDANIFGTLRRKIVAAVPAATDEPAAEPAAEPTPEPVVTDADAEAVMIANADAEPVPAPAFDAAATVDAYRSGMPWADRRAAFLALGDDEQAAVLALFGQDEVEAYLDDAILGVGMNPVFRAQVIARYEEIAPELAARARKAYEDNMPGDPADERPGPKTERKARKARAAKAAAGNADAAPAETPAPANPGRAGKGLKAETLAWHRANPGTAAKAEELKAIFGAKWAGPIRIHQRNLVESGHLVRVGDTKPETYRLADNAPADA